MILQVVTKLCKYHELAVTLQSRCYTSARCNQVYAQTQIIPYTSSGTQNPHKYGPYKPCVAHLP